MRGKDSELLSTTKSQDDDNAVPLNDIGITKTTDLTITDEIRSNSFGKQPGGVPYDGGDRVGVSAATCV